ncbi:3-hydroxyacyl-CoA dehydrogenase [Halosolutus amylolyticus]|uniref:3-hydroxyacyl-CoA dehydrogenase n=1 Tax=Halosolutus amylolyticus TaxID=2932267 RepID=A0ABD5PIZ5_9EURY|nr:3-hydroxyacyl-CoA dehydrogenase [Halosolutus amylolyticus]
MSKEKIQSVTVVGAGNMGHGIAEVIALAGYEVTLHDIDEDALQTGYEQITQSLQDLSTSGRIDESPSEIVARIDTEPNSANAIENVDLVIEAVSEDMGLKRNVFSELDEHAPADAILATNTSSLSITDIGEGTNRSSKVVGMHFFNPPVLMQLVEVIYGEETSERTVETVADFARALGKTPISVEKDVHGFVVNNVLAPFSVEADHMVSDGESSIRAIDSAMVHRRGYPMGPFELGDMSGIDVTYEAQDAGDKPVPPLMEEKYEAGEYGRKTGKGYYDYDLGDGAEYSIADGSEVDTFRIEACLINEAASLIEREIATAADIDKGVKLGAGFPEGICERADAIGIGVVYNKLRTLYEASGHERHKPSPRLKTMVEEGRTGKTAGEGFHTYDNDEQ